jgi:hypothetical protein
MPVWLVSRVARQIVAALTGRCAVRSPFALARLVFRRLDRTRGRADGAVGVGGLVSFRVAFLIGGVDRDRIAEAAEGTQ